MPSSHDELLSSHLGRPVRLAEAPRGAVVYGGPLTVVTTASIAELGARAGFPDLLAEAARFRATLLVETDIPFVEDTWYGREMRVEMPAGTVSHDPGPHTDLRPGPQTGLRIRIGAPVPRCAVIDLDPVTGARGSRLLTTLAACRDADPAGEPFFGVCAEVV